MEVLTEYCDEELSLRVMNEERFYQYVEFNHWPMLIAVVRLLFKFNKAQLADLKETFDDYQKENS